ncbi:MAG: hypothetical protein C4297_03720 [Gemmataceae bacterium]
MWIHQHMLKSDIELLLHGLPGLTLGVLAFLVPGWIWCGVVGPVRTRMRDRIAYGCIWSLAVFGSTAWPALWFRWRLNTFLWCLLFVWFLWTVIGIVLSWLARTGGTALSGAARQPGSSAAPDNGDATVAAEQAAACNGWPWYHLPAWACAAGAPAVLAVLIVRWLQRPAPQYSVDEATALVVGCILFGLWIVAWLLAAFCRRSWYSPIVAADRRPASRMATWAAIGFVSLQTVSAVVMDRPDWDDVYSLSAALDFLEGAYLNEQEPSHREGFAIPAHSRLLAWELAGAVLCYVSGLPPQILFHTVLPALLVPLAYLAYWLLLEELLPRRWVPYAILGLATYAVWGISSHSALSNYLLTRIWQGKAALGHIAVPLVATLLLRSARDATRGTWASSVACGCAGLVMSSSAVFLLPMLLASLGSALFLVAKPARSGLAAAVVLGCLPCGLIGTLMYTEVLQDPIVSAGYGWFNWRYWFATLGSYAGEGTVEVVWLFLLPWLATGLPCVNARAYSVLYPGILTLLFCNPLAYDVVAQYLTSYWTYFRVLWLYPVAAGLGVFTALAARFVALRISSVAAWGGGVVTDLRHRSRCGRSVSADEIAALATAALLIAVSAFIPGIYVWDPVHNNYLGLGCEPRAAENLRKMPEDLREIADKLLADKEVATSRVRLLCRDAVVNALAPYDRRFRFVQTRTLYTLPFAIRSGREAEGKKRYLANLILEGLAPGQFRRGQTELFRLFGSSVWPDLPEYVSREQLGAILDGLAVRYAIVHRGDWPALRALADADFERWEAVGAYEVWRRPLVGD